MAKKRKVDASVSTLSGRTDTFSIWKNRLETTHRIWRGYRLYCQPFYDAYEGLFDDSSRNSNYYSIPLAFAHAKFRIPSLYLKDPYFKVRARTPFSIESSGDAAALGMPARILDSVGNPVRDNVLGAEILENELAYSAKEDGFKWNAKLSILDALFCYGVMKLGYSTEHTYDPVMGPVEEAIAVPGDDSRETLEWNESVKRDMVWAMRVDPWDFRYDPHIKQLDPWLSQCRWVAFRTLRPVEDVKADKLYKNTAGLEGHGYPDDDKEMRSKSTSDDLDEPMAILWEVWDKKARKLYVIAEGHDKFLREEDWPFDMDGFPCAFIHYNDIPTFRRGGYSEQNPFGRVPGPFPLPDFANWHDLNKVLNMSFSMAVEAMRRNPDKIIYNKGAIEPQELNKLTSPLTKGLVEVNDVNSLKVLATSGAANDKLPVIQQAVQWIYQVSGVSGQQRGVSAAETATEASFINSNVEARQAESLDRVKDWMQVIARKRIQLMKQFFTKERIVPVVGREDFEWIPYTKDNIQGEYDVDVHLVPFDPTKPEVAAKQATDILALLSKFPQIPDGRGGFVQVNLARLVEEIISALPIRIPARELLIPVNPMMMQPGMAQPGQGGLPLPGEGSGADGRSPIASQGAGASMTQAAVEGGPQSQGAGIRAGAMTPSRGGVTCTRNG